MTVINSDFLGSDPNDSNIVHYVHLTKWSKFAAKTFEYTLSGGAL